MLLYHGSRDCFEKINLEKAKEYRDFGKAFYLAEEYYDSLNLVRKNKGGYLYTYEYEPDLNLSVLEFAKKDLLWADFIYNCRNTKNFGYKTYDLIIGDTAGGNILKYIKDHRGDYKYYLNNKEEFLQVISDTTLKRQFAFINEKSLSTLKLIDIEKFEKEDFYE